MPKGYQPGIRSAVARKRQSFIYDSVVTYSAPANDPESHQAISILTPAALPSRERSFFITQASRFAAAGVEVKNCSHTAPAATVSPRNAKFRATVDSVLSGSTGNVTTRRLNSSAMGQLPSS